MRITSCSFGRSHSIKFDVKIIIWKLSVVMSPSRGVDLQVGWDNLSCQCLKSIANVFSRDISGTQFCGHWTLRLIYGAAIGFERGLQSRSQKVASNYDIFGALLEMLGKAPVSTRAQFSRSQFELYLAPFWTPFELHFGSQSRPLVQLSALKACRSTLKQGFHF